MDGYNNGFAAGSDAGQDKAWRADVDAVLGELRFRQFELHDEIRYEEHLVDSRRRSLISMIDLLESIIAMFTPQQQPEADQSDVEGA